MFLQFNILDIDGINHKDLQKGYEYFSARVQRSPNTIIVGYDTFEELNKINFDFKVIYGLDVLVDFNILDSSCNFSLRY